jgi:hypothetical protein
MPMWVDLSASSEGSEVVNPSGTPQQLNVGWLARQEQPAWSGAMHIRALLQNLRRIFFRLEGN